MHRSSKLFLLALSIPILALPLGCKSSAAYKNQLEPTYSAIQTAEESGAGTNSSASYYLRLAKQEFEEAKILASKGKKAQATSLLLRAEADAELAEAMAQADSEKNDAADAGARIHQLRLDNDMPVSDDDKEVENENNE